MTSPIIRPQQTSPETEPLDLNKLPQQAHNNIGALAIEENKNLKIEESADVNTSNILDSSPTAVEPQDIQLMSDMPLESHYVDPSNIQSILRFEEQSVESLEKHFIEPLTSLANHVNIEPFNSSFKAEISIPPKIEHMDTSRDTLLEAHSKLDNSPLFLGHPTNEVLDAGLSSTVFLLNRGTNERQFEAGTEITKEDEYHVVPHDKPLEDLTYKMKHLNISTINTGSSPILHEVTSLSTQPYYIKSLRLSSEVLRTLSLKEGSNRVRFVAERGGTCSCKLFKWNSTDQIVISDIDGTITKSDVFGHLFTMVGKDWTQMGVAKLFTKIFDNGYKIIYLTSRAIGQVKISRFKFTKKISSDF